MLTLLCLLAAVGGPVATDSLAAHVRERVQQVPGAEVGVAFHRLGSPSDTLYINADESIHAASTMKVPVMIELFRQVDAHGLSLDQKILLANQFGSIVDGSPYSLSSSDDSDSLVYGMVGDRVSVRDLMYHMITRSSNLATNALIALVGAKRTTAAMRSLGAEKIQVLRGVEDEKAYERGLNNTTTARDLAIIMEAIQENRAASPESCEEMRQILLHQEFNDEIPAGLPPGTPVAHKTGQITAHLHDAAIVYPRDAGPYVLVILTRGIPDEKVARSLMADISRMVYEHVMSETATTGSGRN
ncbi:MAG TPA: serine hydrolase [Gemmatimonadaceae bacterium]|nr:serine hydrolase [Gemmatimonadaceae bacterium]